MPGPSYASDGPASRLDMVEVMKQSEKEILAEVRSVVAALIHGVVEESREKRACISGRPVRSQGEITAVGPEGAREDNDEKDFLIHHVNHRSDSLLGLSLRYGVPVPQIRRDNQLSVFNDSIKAYGELRIRRLPNAPHLLVTSVLDPKVLDLQKLMKSTGLSKQESEYYMSMADHDFDAALAEYKEDLAWEKANKKKPVAAFEVES